ncbi:MAG: polyprenyl synthetase family protein [Eubacterium sp.]|nr:polyprenyl synthetase family protein [Eubacterium sp.]
MDKSEFKTILEKDIEIIEKAIMDRLPVCKDHQDEVVSAMKYSLSNGGKRLRPVFCLEFANCCGLEKEKALDFACALEFIHTYSLIHDDLPCMDNDDFRRGKPSCHKQFGEATALLAGDALLTHAFELLANADLSADKRIEAVSVLSSKSGVAGMIGGQVIDLKYESENPDLSQILSVHRLKTGALIAAACLLGCIAAGANEKQMHSAKEFAYNLGIAFQIKDDILDVVGNSEELGKPIGSDAENDKTTYISIKGLEASQKDVEDYTEKAISSLSAFKNSAFIKMLAEVLINRSK